MSEMTRWAGLFASISVQLWLSYSIFSVLRWSHSRSRRNILLLFVIGLGFALNLYFLAGDLSRVGVARLRERDLLETLAALGVSSLLVGYLVHRVLGQTPYFKSRALIDDANALLAKAVAQPGSGTDSLLTQAGEKYRAANSLAPRFFDALFGWGCTLLLHAHNESGVEQKRLYALAAEKFQAAIRIKPDSAPTYVRWGNTLLAQARVAQGEEAIALFGRAAALFEQALKIDAQDFEALVGWARALWQQADSKDSNSAHPLYAMAVEKLESALAIHQDPIVTYNLGHALLGLHRYAEAETAYRQAIGIDPEYYLAYGGLGYLLETHLGRNSEAETAYRQAIQVDPNQTDAYWALANLLIKMQRYSDAVPVLQDLITLAPRDVYWHVALARVYRKIGQNRLAQEQAALAKSLVPADDWINLTCIESLYGHTDKAFEYLRRAAQDRDFDPLWAWQDQNLEWLRDDPRFEEIVGPRPPAI